MGSPGGSTRRAPVPVPVPVAGGRWPWPWPVAVAGRVWLDARTITAGETAVVLPRYGGGAP